MLEIVFFPEQGSVVKRRSGDFLEVTALVKKSSSFSPDDLVVELWTNAVDDSPEALRFFPVPMVFSREEPDHFVFVKRLPLKNTGFFSFTVRARLKEHNFWSWASGSAELLVDPSWIKNAVFYNAFVRFFGAEDRDGDGVISPGEAGSFDDLKHDLKNLKALGVDAIYINPIHPIGELYRNLSPHDLLPDYLHPGCPYSVKDYKAIDPELAVDKDDEDKDPEYSDPFTEFRELVNEAHRLGMRVIMDLVFNHAAHDCVFQRLHPEWFLYKENIKSLDDPFIYPDELKDGKPWGDPKHTFCPFDHGVFWEDVAQINWEYKIPPAVNSPPPNPTIDEMRRYFKSIPKFWVNNFGVDGFRCDVAYRVPPDFWRECIRETRIMAKNSFPSNGSLDGDVVFIAESYTDDLDLLQKAGFSLVYGDFSNKLFSPLTLKGYLDYIYNVDGRYFPDGSAWFHFPECHDFLRTPHKILGDKLFEVRDSDVDVRVNKSRWVLTATLPGVPMIFNGFEKVEWKAVNLFGYSSIDWSSHKDIRDYIRRVVSIRKEHPALAFGGYSYLENEFGLNEGSQLMSFLRFDDSEELIVIVNMDVHNPVNGTKVILEGLRINLERFFIKDLLTGRVFERSGPELPVFLGPGESHIFLVSQDPF